MPELLDKVRTLIRIRHYSYRTEQTYIHWIKQFIHFHNKRHLAEWVRRKSLSFFRSSPSVSWHTFRHTYSSTPDCEWRELQGGSGADAACKQPFHSRGLHAGESEGKARGPKTNCRNDRIG